MESTLEAQMVSNLIYIVTYFTCLLSFQSKSSYTKLTWLLHDMIVSDTVEAFESGKLAQLLGIAASGKDDL